jgi:hypothetical protein
MGSDTTRVPIEPGDFIEIPAWSTIGCVMRVERDTSGLGSADCLNVLLQEDCDAPEEQWRRYRLEPNEYWVLE